MDLMCNSRKRTWPFPKRLTRCIPYIFAVFVLYLIHHIINLTITLREMENRLHSMALGTGSSNNVNLELRGLYEFYKTSGKLGSLDAISLNNTRKVEKQILVFNRVPKVGSQTMMQLLMKLAERNNFIFHLEPPRKFEAIILELPDEQALAERISGLETPSSFEKHVAFTNFSKFNLPTPIYINMVRDPVERVISWFYYARAPWVFAERKRDFPDLPLPDTRWYRRDYETCILSGDSECKYAQGANTGGQDYRSQALFFCGHNPNCNLFNTDYALDQAKNAVENQYSVVGVLEDMATTLAVFEKYIPRFFAGATEIYNNDIKRFNKVNKNSFKPPVSEEVKNIVRKNFTKEIEFYNFCKMRLQSQFLAVNLKEFEIDEK